MAKITKITYGRTKNNGNYENTRASIELELEDGDTLNGVRSLAQVLVAEQLGDLNGVEAVEHVNNLIERGAISRRGIEESWCA